MLLRSTKEVRFELYVKQFLIVIFLLFSVNYFAFSQTTAKAANIDILISQAKLGNKSLTAHSYCDVALYYLYQDSFRLALKYAHKVNQLAILEEDYFSLARQYIVKGQVYLSFSSYVKSIDNFSLAEQLSLEHKFPKILVNANYGLGLVYKDLKEYKKALEVLNRGLIIAKEHNNLQDEAIIYNALGSTLQRQGNLEESIVYLNKYYQIALTVPDTLHMIYALINIGESNRMQSKYKEALINYHRAQSLNRSIDDSQAEAAIFGNLALIYAAHDDVYNEIKFYIKSIVISRNSSGLAAYLQQDLMALAKAYAKQQQYDSSYVYYKQYIALSDSVSELDYMERINALHYGHELEENESHALLLAQKLYRRTIVIIFLTILCIVTILLLVTTYSRYKLKTRKMKDDMTSLNFSLDRKNRELVASLIDLSVHTETFNDINTILSELEKENDTEISKQRLLELMSKLTNIEKANNKWDSFKLHFEQVHPDFFIKLKDLSNNLTTNDIRFCAYIKLNLESKDIASILNISIRAAQATRLRIKKKLKLPPTDDLISYIQAL